MVALCGDSVLEVKVRDVIQELLMDAQLIIVNLAGMITKSNVSLFCHRGQRPRGFSDGISGALSFAPKFGQSDWVESARARLSRTKKSQQRENSILRPWWFSVQYYCQQRSQVTFH
jgi:hypothetical protein